MQPFKYTPPRVRTGDLRTWVDFYVLKENDDFIPSEKKEKDIAYECWSKVDQVWSKDFEIAKANGTLSDLTLTIRETHGEFTPTNLHLVTIHAPEYKDITFNVKQVMPDLQTRGFTKVICEVVS